MSEKFLYAGPGRYLNREREIVTIIGEVAGVLVSTERCVFEADTGSWDAKKKRCRYDLVGTRLPDIKLKPGRRYKAVNGKTGIAWHYGTGQFVFHDMLPGAAYSEDGTALKQRAEWTIVEELPPSPEDFGLSRCRVYVGSEIDADLRGRMLASQEAGLKWQVIIVDHNKDSWETVRVNRVDDTGALAYRIVGSTAEPAPTLPPVPQGVWHTDDGETELFRELRTWQESGGTIDVAPERFPLGLWDATVHGIDDFELPIKARAVGYSGDRVIPGKTPPPQIVIRGDQIDTEAGRLLREWVAAGGKIEWLNGKHWQSVRGIPWYSASTYYRAVGCTIDAPTPPQPAPVAATDVIDQRIAAAFERLAAVWRDKPWNGSACIEFVAAELRKGSE